MRSHLSCCIRPNTSLFFLWNWSIPFCMMYISAQCVSSHLGVHAWLQKLAFLSTGYLTGTMLTQNSSSSSGRASQSLTPLCGWSERACYIWPLMHSQVCRHSLVRKLPALLASFVFSCLSKELLPSSRISDLGVKVPVAIEKILALLCTMMCVTALWMVFGYARSVLSASRAL